MIARSVYLSKGKALIDLLVDGKDALKEKGSPDPGPEFHKNVITVLSLDSP